MRLYIISCLTTEFANVCIVGSLFLSVAFQAWSAAAGERDLFHST